MDCCAIKLIQPVRLALVSGFEMSEEPISVEVTWHLNTKRAAETEARLFRTFGRWCILPLIPSVFVPKLQFSSMFRFKYSHIVQAGHIGWASKGV